MTAFSRRFVRRPAEAGDIAIYISLIMLMIFLTGGIVLSLVLSRQMRSVTNILSSERAFYAAGSASEQMFYRMANLPQLYFQGNPVALSGTIDYSGDLAGFSIDGLADQDTGAVSYCSVGSFRALKRRLIAGSYQCTN